MRNNTWFKLGGAALLGLVVLNFANVTLSATLQPPQQNVRFQWDLNKDGIFDTPLSPNPTVTHLYPDETNVTAVVKVVKGRRSATDPVTFSTLRCGG